MTRPGDLLKAHNDTFGVQEDMGADPDVLRDLGYDDFPTTNERILDLVERQERVAGVAFEAGRIICADCGKVVPCAHHRGFASKVTGKQIQGRTDGN